MPDQNRCIVKIPYKNNNMVFSVFAVLMHTFCCSFKYITTFLLQAEHKWKNIAKVRAISRIKSSSKCFCSVLLLKHKCKWKEKSQFVVVFNTFFIFVYFVSISIHFFFFKYIYMPSFFHAKLFMYVFTIFMFSSNTTLYVCIATCT